MAKKFLQKAIKHPGALTAAAKKHGVSKLQEARKEAHSSNPHIRARGILGERLIAGDLHHGSGHHQTVHVHLHGGGKKGFRI
jgi:hypothetical protein